MGNIRGINHLALITGDMEKTTRYYRDTLEMPLVAATGNKPNGLTYRHYFFKLGEGNTIAFFEYPNVVERHKEAGVPEDGWLQIDHIAFNVEDETALLALRERLLSNGEDVTVVVDHKIVKSIYFTDPNGIQLEASFWIRDPTAVEPDYGDPEFFDDPDPVPSARPVTAAKA